MSFQIHLRGPGLNMITRIKDGALNDILKLLQEHRDDQSEPPGWPEGPHGQRGMGPPHRPGPPRHGEGPPPPPPGGRPAKRPQKDLSPEAAALAKKLASLPTPPLAEHANLTFPERLLLLGAWTEARKEKFILRGPTLVESFVQAGQTPPANPKRDVMAAVRSGWVTLGMFPNPNRATLTPEGWERVGEMIG